MVYKSSIKSGLRLDSFALVTDMFIGVVTLMVISVVGFVGYSFHLRGLTDELRVNSSFESLSSDYYPIEVNEPLYLGDGHVLGVDVELVDEEIDASTILAFNPVTQDILYERNSNKQVSIASITKLMTVLVAQDYFEPEDLLVADEYDLEYLEWVIGLEEGDRVTYEDTLKAMLMSSYNDAAYLIASNYDGGYDEFVELMNTKALQIGMEDTHFTNPAGLDNSEHYSTAWDLKRLVKKVLEDEYLLDIVGEYSDSISIEKASTESEKIIALKSTNQLLGTTSYMKGLKTGFTSKAGASFVSYYRISDDNQLVTIILDAKGDRFEETKELVDLLGVY